VRENPRAASGTPHCHIALRVGPAKRKSRIIQVLQEEAVDIGALCVVIGRHRLRDAWLGFCRRAGIADPCKL
jgi:hypothetical protein